MNVGSGLQEQVRQLFHGANKRSALVASSGRMTTVYYRPNGNEESIVSLTYKRHCHQAVLSACKETNLSYEVAL